MQIVSCAVALAGDLNNVRVYDAIDGITVPEVIVMREVHGFDAVTDIKVVGNVKRSGPEEVKRLSDKYDWNRNGENAQPIIPKLFPGARPNLPTTIDEILGEVASDESSTASSDETTEADAAPPTAKRKARAEALD